MIIVCVVGVFLSYIYFDHKRLSISTKENVDEGNFGLQMDEVDPIKLAEVTCENANEFLLPEGTCVPCFPYTIPSEDKLSCVEPVCDDDSIIDFNGECYKCRPYKIPDVTKMECDFPDCPPRHIIESDGTCTLCPDYEENKTNFYCGKPSCEEYEFITIEAKCESCQPYEVMTTDGKSCI